MRTLVAVVVALLLAGTVPTAALAAPSGTSDGSEPGAVVHTPSKVDTVTDAMASTDDDADNTTDTTTDPVDTVTDPVEGVDETANGTAGSGADAVNRTATTLENATGNTTLSATGTVDAGVDGGSSVAGGTDVDVAGPTGTVRVTAGGEVEGLGATDTVRPTASPTTTAGNASAGSGVDAGKDGGVWNDGDLPATAGGAVAVGLGAAVAASLARRSATFATLAPDIATSLSRLPSPFARLRAGSWGREWLPRLLGLFGYSRYDGSDPLEHDTRAALLERIEESPGTYLSELSERTDVPVSTLRHHLDVLVREGVVTTAHVRGRRRYFSLDAGNETLAAALADDASAAVLECLAAEGPASVSAIAEGLDRDVSTVSHHLKRLAEDGLVERRREGRSVFNRLAADVEDALGRADADQPRPARAQADD